MTEEKFKHVVVIGGGFAGLAAAKVLSREPTIRTTLVDRRNHHLFQPLLYQVATAGLNPSDIAVPIRAQFSNCPNVSVQLGEVRQIRLADKTLRVDDRNLQFDALIIACGVTHSYFGKNHWEAFAPGLKTLEQATEIRRRILMAFEQAETEIDATVQAQLLTFVIVGAGPTGVELAGAIADISRTVLVRDFRRINSASARVILIEAGARPLAQFDETLSVRTERDLKSMGVEVRTGTRVQEISQEGVSAVDASGQTQWIASRSVFWAAGVQAEPIELIPDVPRDPAGRIHVAADLSVTGFPGVFVVGDLARLELSPGVWLPGLAPAAIQTGRWAAKNCMATFSGAPLKPFSYLDKGIMATIGKHRAVAQTGSPIPGLKLTGVVAWLAWLLIHILYLIDFKNRIAVIFEWTWSYVFSKRGARLITGKHKT